MNVANYCDVSSQKAEDRTMENLETFGDDPLQGVRDLCGRLLLTEERGPHKSRRWRHV